MNPNQMIAALDVRASRPAFDRLSARASSDPVT